MSQGSAFACSDYEGKLEWQSFEDALRLEERVTPHHAFHEVGGW
jgi:hypothetical protein